MLNQRAVMLSVRGKLWHLVWKKPTYFYLSMVSAGRTCLWLNCGPVRSWRTHSQSSHFTVRTHRLKCVLSWQDDEVVLQCVACIQKENRKFCLAAEGLGNRLCYLEPTSEAKVGRVTPLLHVLAVGRLRSATWSKCLFSLQVDTNVFSSFEKCEQGKKMRSPRRERRWNQASI